MSHIRATATVPPRASIIRFASANLSMSQIVGESNCCCNNPIENNWHDRLNSAFDRANIGRARFGELVGVSQPTVHDWLKGKIQMIAGDHLVRVCEVLRVNPLWLMTGRGDMVAEDRRADQRRQADRRN